MKRTTPTSLREYEFALIVSGVPELNGRVEDAIFSAGCDDATVSMRYGRLYVEFSRSAPSLKDAIISAIRDVAKAGIGARVLRVDDCNLVSAADVARRIGRTRQLVHQYITGQRGRGGFPAPVCRIAERAPIWSWCEVSRWLATNGLVSEEVWRNAEVVEAINAVLDAPSRERAELVNEIERELRAAGVPTAHPSVSRARRSA